LNARFADPWSVRCGSWRTANSSLTHLGLSVWRARRLADALQARRKERARHALVGCCASVFGRSAGYEDRILRRTSRYDPALRGLSAARPAQVARPASPKPEGLLRDTWLTAERNLFLRLLSLPGPVDSKRMGNRPPKGHRLDMDSSVRPTQWRAGDETWNGHTPAPAIIRLFVLNRSADVGALSATSGNGCTVPRRGSEMCSARCGPATRGKGSWPRLFRAGMRRSPCRVSTSISTPSGIKVCDPYYSQPIRFSRIGIGCTAQGPVGRPPNEWWRRFTPTLTYQAARWSKRAGKLTSRVGTRESFIPPWRFLWNEHEPSGRACRAFYNKRGNASNGSKEGQGRDR